MRLDIVRHSRVIIFARSVGGSLLNDLTDTDTTTPTLATSLSNAGDVFQALAFAFGHLYGYDIMI